MIPVYIEPEIKNLTTKQLQEKLDYYAYIFTIISNHSDKESEDKLIKNLEKYILEALNRIIKIKLGFYPKQNKIFERVEQTFNNYDSYNINRTISAIRRIKIFGLNPSDEKYIRWLENRVFNAVKSINEELNNLIIKEQKNKFCQRQKIINF